MVLDASALMAFFEARRGGVTVHEFLSLAADGKLQIAMSVVNWGEMYYSVWLTKGPGFAVKVIEDISQLPIELVDADQQLTKAAAELRANYKLPYCDCFAAALALQRKAPLVTSDSDFARVASRIKIVWTH